MLETIDVVVVKCSKCDGEHDSHSCPFYKDEVVKVKSVQECRNDILDMELKLLGNDAGWYEKQDNRSCCVHEILRDNRKNTRYYKNPTVYFPGIGSDERPSCFGDEIVDQSTWTENTNRLNETIMQWYEPGSRMHFGMFVLGSVLTLGMFGNTIAAPWEAGGTSAFSVYGNRKRVQLHAILEHLCAEFSNSSKTLEWKIQLSRSMNMGFEEDFCNNAGTNTNATMLSAGYARSKRRAPPDNYRFLRLVVSLKIAKHPAASTDDEIIAMLTMREKCLKEQYGVYTQKVLDYYHG
jgi:hypothetical protein